MTHDGKVVVDNQGRVMGKDGKLLRDKKGNYVYMRVPKKKKEKQEGSVADSGETHKKNDVKERKAAKNGKAAKAPKVATVTPSRLPFSKKNAISKKQATTDDLAGQWSAAELAAWQSHLGKENKSA